MKAHKLGRQAFHPAIVLLLSFLLAACAAPQQRASNDGGRLFESLQAAQLALKPTGEIAVGGAARLMIDEKKSPLLKQGGVNNRFEILELNGSKGQRFTFTTVSVCDCLGFRKWAVFAASSVLDAQGEVIATDSPGRDPQTRQIDGVFPADGRYYLFVVADRTFEGRPMGQVSATGPTGLPLFDIPITVHATGDVIVKWVAQK